MATHSSDTYYAPPDKAPIYHQDATHHQQFYDAYAPSGGYEPSGGKEAGSPAIGMKRSVFIAGAVVTAILLALVIGLGAGLGVSQRNLHQAQADLSAVQSSAAELTGTPTTVWATTTASSTSSTKASSSAKPNPTCAAKKDEVYTATNSSKTFAQFCGIDYNKGEANDVAKASTKTFEACMDACANNEQCQGCGWGVMDTDKNGNHTCWMKANLTRSHNASADWAFAVLNLESAPV